MATISHDSETPAHGQQVFSACAFIHKLQNGEPVVLLARRAATKKFLPGVYELPGGHVEYGESMAGGLRREIAEELSVGVNIGDPFYVFTYGNLLKGSQTIEVVYFATLAEAEATIQIAEDDHSDYGWFTKNQVETIVAENRAGVTGLDSIQIDADDEILAMLKGFDVINNKTLNFG